MRVIASVMGIRAGSLAIFVLALVLIGAGVFVYRQGYIRSRAALVAIAILVGLLVVWGMSPGVAPAS